MQRLLGTQQLRLGYQGLGTQVLALQFVRIAQQVHQQFATGREQRMLAETCGRVIEEVAAAQGQGAHLRGTVGGDVQRGRAASGVIARHGLTLQHDDAGVSGQPVTGGGTGNTAADDDVVGLVHVFLLECESAESKCGSGLARECGVSVSGHID